MWKEARQGGQWAVPPGLRGPAGSGQGCHSSEMGQKAEKSQESGSSVIRKRLPDTSLLLSQETPAQGPSGRKEADKQADPNADQEPASEATGRCCACAREA